MSVKLHHDRNSVLSYNPLLAFVCLDRGIGVNNINGIKTRINYDTLI